MSQIADTQIDESIAIFTPLYINYGKYTKIDKNVFINFDCTFLDLGGITIEDNIFDSHESRSVCNASQLDRNLLANVFNELWNNSNKPVWKEQNNIESRIENQPTKDLFEFISQKHSRSSDLGQFSLFPQVQDEDYEEEKFANQMKKKKKKGKRL